MNFNNRPISTHGKTVPAELVQRGLQIAERLLRHDGLQTVGALGSHSPNGFPSTNQQVRSTSPSFDNDDIVRAEMIIPLHLNNGTPLLARDIAHVYIKVARAFGGITVWTCFGLAVGGCAELDASVWVLILLRKSRVSVLSDLAKSFEKRFRQREIFWFTSPVTYRAQWPIEDDATCASTAAE